MDLMTTHKIWRQNSPKTPVEHLDPATPLLNTIKLIGMDIARFLLIIPHGARFIDRLNRFNVHYGLARPSQEIITSEVLDLVCLEHTREACYEMIIAKNRFFQLIAEEGAVKHHSKYCLTTGKYKA